MKFTTLIALVGLTTAIKITQKRGDRSQEGGDNGEKRGRGPSAAEIFEHCDANADALLTLEEAVGCASAAITAEWPVDASGAAVAVTEEQLQEYLQSRGPKKEEALLQLTRGGRGGSRGGDSQEGGERQQRGGRSGEDQEEGEERRGGRRGEGSGSDSEREEREMPTAAEIFEACDANQDAELTLDEAITCASAQVTEHIRE